MYKDLLFLTIPVIDLLSLNLLICYNFDCYDRNKMYKMRLLMWEFKRLFHALLDLVLSQNLSYFRCLIILFLASCRIFCLLWCITILIFSLKHHRDTHYFLEALKNCLLYVRNPVFTFFEGEVILLQHSFGIMDELLGILRRP
jgi:hypothetical protein